MKNNTFKNYTKKIGLEGLVIFDITQDRNGDMWFVGKGERFFGEGGGAYHYDGNTTTRYSIANGLPDNNLYKVYQDDDGSMFFCTSSGITHLKDGVITNYNNENGLCTGVAISIVADAKNNLWIGTLGGLVFYDHKSFKCLKQEDGMSSETIYLLQMENDSTLWVGSANGLDKLNVSEFYRSGQIQTEHFDEEDGFLGLECNQNATCIDHKGNIWFGTILSAIKYNPKAGRKNAQIPNTHITGVFINGVETDIGSTKTEITGDRDALRLSSNLKNIAFDFIGISLSNPQNVTYSYFLEGYDTQWSLPNTNTRANYTNLPPGDYLFKVRSQLGSVVYSAETSKFAFRIVPPIWLRWWFIALFACCLAALIYYLFRRRANQIRREEKMKAEFDKQLAEVELKALRAQMNPHFLFNCLNSIKHFIIKNDVESASNYLSKFSRLMRLTLDNSKASKITLKRELEALKLYIDLEDMRFENKFDYEINIDDNVPAEEVEVPPLILQPFVENAIWHGLMHKKERGMLKVNLTRKEGSLVCEIEDNGVGRQRAGELKSKSATKTKSMGIKITSSRIKQNSYNGKGSKIEVEDLVTNNTAAGTKVTISIPVDFFAS